MKAIVTTTVAAGALCLLAGAASAQTAVTAVTDLNVRAGPGPQYEVIGVLPMDAAAALDGCLADQSWCRISYSGEAGWVFSDYLAADHSGSRVIVTERRAELAVPDVVYDGDGMPVVAGGTTGAIVAGSGPDVVVGGDMAPPPDAVRTYVVDHPADQVYLDGEVVVGAGLPDTVELREIPDYQYRYVYVNGQPALIEPDTRRVVYIVR